MGRSGISVCCSICDRNEWGEAKKGEWRHLCSLVCVAYSDANLGGFYVLYDRASIMLVHTWFCRWDAFIFKFTYQPHTWIEKACFFLNYCTISSHLLTIMQTFLLVSVSNMWKFMFETVRSVGIIIFFSFLLLGTCDVCMPEALDGLAAKHKNMCCSRGPAYFYL
jgi:hypothetical protein